MQQKEVEYNRKYYDEWIDTYQTHHLDFDEWQKSKGIKVKEDPFILYSNELQPVMQEYLRLDGSVRGMWSACYRSKEWDGSLSDKIEQTCQLCVQSFVKVQEIDKKYKIKPMTYCGASYKLILLYERRGDLKKAVEACDEALVMSPGEEKYTRKREKLIKRMKRLNLSK